jgi:hypothetical protein
VNFLKAGGGSESYAVGLIKPPKRAKGKQKNTASPQAVASQMPARLFFFFLCLVFWWLANNLKMHYRHLLVWSVA